MSKNIHISKIEKITVVALGLLIAVFSILTPYQKAKVSEDPEHSLVKVADLEDGEQSPEENDHSDNFELKALDAVPNALQGNVLSSFAGVINNYIYEEEIVENEKPQWRLQATSKYLKTLFRYIISPNAP